MAMNDDKDLQSITKFYFRGWDDWENFIEHINTSYLDPSLSMGVRFMRSCREKKTELGVPGNLRRGRNAINGWKILIIIHYFIKKWNDKLVFFVATNGNIGNGKIYVSYFLWLSNSIWSRKYEYVVLLPNCKWDYLSFQFFVRIT